MEQQNKRKLTREGWLVLLARELEKIFFPDMPKYRVSLGWPKSSNATGECWTKSCSTDGTFEIFIAPIRDDMVLIAETLTHEMIHAYVGLQEGHRGRFRRKALSVGLEGPMTSTRPGPKFIETISPVLEKLGPIPHKKMIVWDADFTHSSGKKKQESRMKKCACDDCGYTVRVAQKWIDEVGLPHCPEHGAMTEKDK